MFGTDNFDVEEKLNDAAVIVESRSSEPVMFSVDVGHEIDAVEVQLDISIVINCTNFGDFNKLINTNAFVLRFINNINAKKNGKDCILNGMRCICITVNERRYALDLWLKAEQANMFKANLGAKL